MSSQPLELDRYHHVQYRKEDGAHYTPVILANFVAEKIIAAARPLKKKVRILDPAIGDGELIISLLETLKQYPLEIEVYGFDTNLESIKIATKRISKLFPNAILDIRCADFLQQCLWNINPRYSGNLFEQSNLPLVDLLIANPPYVRTRVLGAKQSQQLSKRFGLKGKVDLYQAFLLAISAVLSPEGIAGVIVSNRFMTTKGAGNLREALKKQYNIKTIWDLGDTKLFEAAVLPAILLFTLKTTEALLKTTYISIYEYKGPKETTISVQNPIEGLNHQGIVECTDGRKFKVRHGYLSYDAVAKDVWRLLDTQSHNWLERVKQKTWCVFKNIGKIRVGVKTTADNVFIRANWEQEIGFVPELLKPLTTHHVARRFKRNNTPLKKILYTHYADDNGRRQVYDIGQYPLSEDYLRTHIDQLSSRQYVLDANRNWYEIWVPQQPKLWPQDKIVFRDISDKPTFWLDTEGTVVNGDCYWMQCDNP